MTSKQVLDELKKMGSASIKKILLAHGAKEPLYGVKIGDMKTLVKKIKKDYPLSKELYDSGVYDAMYMAALIADESKMNKKEIQGWAEKANCYGLSEYSVAWVAAESPFGWELGMEWINSSKENIASAGWSTLVGVMALKKDEDLDIPQIKKLLSRIEKEIKTAPNRVRHTMNGFIIGVGSSVKELTKDALEAAKKIGVVTVMMDGTACKEPSAIDYIKKMEDKGYIGKKKKTVKC
jgi:3-methyladenine DNA glycosylase AlkD